MPFLSESVSGEVAVGSQVWFKFRHSESINGVVTHNQSGNLRFSDGRLRVSVCCCCIAV